MNIHIYKKYLTFIMSSLSSSQRTKTEEEGERGREVESEETS